MTKQIGPFRLYATGDPPRLEVWCSDTFRREASDLYHGASEGDRARFANINQLVLRLARGERLSTEAFRREQDGYAFRAGPLRFYGAYSSARLGAFVLSHPILKRQQKLDAHDADRIARCLSLFEEHVRKARQ